jgi:hypothetical protein
MVLEVLIHDQVDLWWGDRWQWWSKTACFKTGTQKERGRDQESYRSLQWHVPSDLKLSTRLYLLKLL